MQSTSSSGPSHKSSGSHCFPCLSPKALQISRPPSGLGSDTGIALIETSLKALWAMAVKLVYCLILVPSELGLLCCLCKLVRILCLFECGISCFFTGLNLEWSRILRKENWTTRIPFWRSALRFWLPSLLLSQYTYAKTYELRRATPKGNREAFSKDFYLIISQLGFMRYFCWFLQ